MKSGTIHEIRKELAELEPAKLIELCLLLARYKKDNKEYLDYLLFQAHDKNIFVSAVRDEMDELYQAIDRGNNLYYIKKSLRKILRLLNKYCKYISDKALEAELHIYYTRKLRESGIAFYKSRVLLNLYEGEIKKIESLIASLHEDLRSDYREDVNYLKDYTWTS